MAIDLDRYREVQAGYLLIMQEVRLRMDAINVMISEIAIEPPYLVREFCWLQLRMIAELIALGCVVAHDRLTTTKLKSLRRQYKPDVIFREIAGYEADFFPFPITVITLRPGEKQLDRDPDIGFDAAGLKRLWGQAGDVLHRGDVRRLDRAKVDTNYPDIRNAQKRLISLLSQHAIVVQESEGVIICELSSASDGQVRCLMSARL